MTTFLQDAFVCPSPMCSAYSQQNWYWLLAESIDQFAPRLTKEERIDYLKKEHLAFKLKGFSERQGYDLSGCHLAVCARCNKPSIWVAGKRIYPTVRTAPRPIADMPTGVRDDFEEAASIAHLSPRGAAGLLRLALEKLCHHLGDPNKKIDTNIKAFVADGLSIKVQQALDAVRVIGNEAVHPGEMDLRDDQETVDILFSLVNLIVQSMITEPKHVEAIYAKLPEAKRTGIENRDKKSDE